MNRVKLKIILTLCLLALAAPQFIFAQAAVPGGFTAGSTPDAKWVTLLGQADQAGNRGDWALKSDLLRQSACYQTGVCNDSVPGGSWVASYGSDPSGRGAEMIRLGDTLQHLKDYSQSIQGYDVMKQALESRIDTVAQTINTPGEWAAINQKSVANQAKDATARNGDELDPNSISCGWWLKGIGCEILKAGIVFLNNVVKPMVKNLVLGGSNWLFNKIIDESVRKFSLYGGSAAPGVARGWTISRDIVDILLIFFLLYIAIGTILDLVQGKKLLISIIMAALLVNFSAFATNILIDASNVVTNQFYDMAGAGPTKQGESPDVAGRLSQMTNISVGDFAFATAGADPMSKLAGIFVQDVGQIILYVITAVVLLSACMMFFVRMITLIFLIILSPFAFLFFTLPKTSGVANKWLSKLFDQVLFAPIFMFLFAITITIASEGGFAKLSKEGGTGYVGFFSMLVYVILINGMMVGSLLIAKNYGAHGASGAMKRLDKLKGFGMGLAGGATAGLAGGLGRTTVGRAGARIRDAEWAKKLANNDKSMVGRFVGRQFLRTGSGLAASSFDARATGPGKELGLGKAGGKGGYDQKVKDKIEAQKKVAERLAPSEEIQGAADAKVKEQQTAIEATTKEIAATELQVRNAPNPQAETAAKARLDSLNQTLQNAKTELASAQAGAAVGATRQKAYAKRLGEGGFGTTLINFSTKRNRQKAARAIKAEADKSPEQRKNEKFSKRLEKALEEMEKEKERSGESAAPKPPAPAPSGTSAP